MYMHLQKFEVYKKLLLSDVVMLYAVEGLEILYSSCIWWVISISSLAPFLRLDDFFLFFTTLPGDLMVLNGVLLFFVVIAILCWIHFSFI